MIRIPSDRLAEWAVELSDACLETSTARRAANRALRDAAATGRSGPGSVLNVTKPTIERLAGMLFSPQKLAFALSYTATDESDAPVMAELCSRMLTANFLGEGAHLAFSAAVRDALTCGTSLTKTRASGAAFEVAIVRAENFGVLRESVNGIDDQNAVCEVSYQTLPEIRDMLGARADAPRLLAEIEALASEAGSSSPATGAQNIVIGVQDPIGSVGTGTVSPIPGAAATSPNLYRTFEVRELWVRDADRGGHWTTIQVVMPGVVILGETRRGNAMLPPTLPNAPTALQGATPYTLIQPYPVRGDFWGWSFGAAVAPFQERVNGQQTLIDRARRRKRRPVVGISGFQGIDPEQYQAMLSDGQLLVSDNPAAKAQELASPDLGPLYEALQAELAMLDRFAGFPAVLRGEGEGSVRSQGHAETLVRTASPRLVEPATCVEEALGDVAALGFRLMQVGDGRSYRTGGSQPFLLSQLPPGWHMTVDSHSATPIFSEDDRTLALELLRLGAIGAEDAITMLRLPNTDLLVEHAKQRAKAAMEMREAELEAGKKAPKK